MERRYLPLTLRELARGAGFRRPTHRGAEQVTLQSPATAVMTDLLQVSPATIRPGAPLSAANQLMITRSVRLLLVVDEAYEKVLGLITATDLLGERPVQAAMSRGVRRDELTVADVMTPALRIEVMALQDVENARVGHLLETLRRVGRQHALAVDAEGMVRGIFSLSQIARQLGVTLVHSGEVALTFSEIEAALVK